MSSLPTTTASSSRSLMERLQHVELIKAMLVWINTEYVKMHGDPWVQEARMQGAEQQQPRRPDSRSSQQRQSTSHPLARSETTSVSDAEEEYDELESEDDDEDATDVRGGGDGPLNSGDYEDERDDEDDEMLASPPATSHLSPALDMEMVAA